MIKIGCTGFPVNKKLYQTNFNLVELDQFKDKTPHKSTVNKWGETFNPDLECAICAPRVITHSNPRQSRMGKRGRAIHPPFSDCSPIRKAFFDVQEAAVLIRAKFLVFELPESAQPSPDHIGRMQSFFKQIPKNSFTLVWEPPSHWPDSLVKNLSHSLSLVTAVNPFKKAPMTNTGLRYFRIGRGKAKEGLHSLTDHELRQLKSSCCSDVTTRVIFNNGPFAYRDALRFKSLIGNP